MHGGTRLSQSTLPRLTDLMLILCAILVLRPLHMACPCGFRRVAVCMQSMHPRRLLNSRIQRVVS